MGRYLRRVAWAVLGGTGPSDAYHNLDLRIRAVEETMDFYENRLEDLEARVNEFVGVKGYTVH